MTELEKEVEDKAIEYADSLEYTIPKFSDEEGYCWSQVEQAYEKGALDFAEPREKENEQLKQQIVGKENEFKYFSNSFQSKIKELQKQIEKMKCCENCDGWDYISTGERDCIETCCSNRSNWRLRDRS